MAKTKDEDLVEILESFCDFRITLNSLKNPSSGFVKAVFKKFLKDCQLDVAAMDVLPWSEVCIIEHKDSYQDVSFAVLFQVMRRFLIPAGVTDFSIQDILEPKYGRTKKIFICLYVFWKHCLIMLKKFEDLEFELQEEINENKLLLDINDDLKSNFEKLQERRVSPEEKEEILNVAKRKKFDEILQKKDAINNQYQVLKTNIANEERKSSELDVHIISEKETIEDLSSKILKSPNRLTSDIDDLKEKIKDEEDRLAESMKKKNQKEEEIVNILSCTGNFEKASDICLELTETIDALKKEAKIIDENQQIINEESQKLKTVESKMVAAEENIAMSEQKWAQNDLQIKMQIEGQKKILEVNQWGLEKEQTLTKQWQNNIASDTHDVLDLEENYGTVSLKLENEDSAFKEKFNHKKKMYKDIMQSYTFQFNLSKEIIKEAA